MRFLGITLLALCFITQAEAAFQYRNSGYQSGYGGGGGYNDYDSPGYGPGGGYGGGNGFQQVGENVNGVAGFLSCGCATRIKMGREKEDIACEQYSRLHQQMILNPGSAIPTTAPTNAMHMFGG